ncbi:MAG: hypothetical protein WDM89_19170 [Rhizomicrobium sp.]
MRISVWLSAFLILAGVGCAASAPESGAGRPPWSERGVFAFDNLVYDFKYKIEAFGPVRTGLINCSTRDFYCAYAWYLHIALPKNCRAFAVGDTWSADDMAITVLYKYTEHIDRAMHSPPPQEILFLGNLNFPGVVYEYGPEIGVRAIYGAKQQDRSDRRGPEWKDFPGRTPFALNW